jgi:steroid delta-isomerase-like uncharacterized protein
MNTQQNITLVKRLFDEVYSKGNVAVLDQILNADFKLIDSSVPNFRGGLAGYKEREQMFKTAFPTKTAKIEEIFATEDRVVVRWTMTGAHKGELQDVAPTGKNVKVCGISIYLFNNSKISEIHQAWDRLALLEQIGVVETTLALHS